MIPTLLPLVLALSSLPQEPALRGLDPVALCEGEEVPGEAGLEARHGSYLYRFASAASRDTFLEDPDRWGIQWDGGCGRMGPLSGKGDATRWTLHAGRLWIFASDDCRAGFLSAPERFVPEPVALDVPTAAQLEEGARWLARAVEAHGGAEALEAAQGLRFLRRSETQGWRHELELVVDRGGVVRRRSAWTPPEGEGAPSESTWQVGPTPEASPAQVDGLDYALTSPAARADVRRAAHREPLVLLAARGRDGFEAIHRGPGALGDAAVVDVEVRWQGLVTRLHLDPESGLVRGLSWRGRAGSGTTGDVVEVVRSWATAGALRTPGERTVRFDGEERGDLGSPWTAVALR